MVGREPALVGPDTPLAPLAEGLNCACRAALGVATQQTGPEPLGLLLKASAWRSSPHSHLPFS